MNVKNKKTIHYVLILSVIFTASCTRNVKEQKILTDNAKCNLIFAGDVSAFKDDIRQKLIDKYKTHANIYIIGNDKLKELDPRKYDSIVIMNTCIAGSPSCRDLQTFINSNGRNNKIILFVTANNRSWKYSYNGVDAITAASKYGNPELIAQEISGRIDGIIAGK